MFDDSFKSRYTTIPFATFSRTDYSAESKNDIFFHNHRETELILVTSGTAHAGIDGEYFRAEKGDIIAISPYTLHHITNYGSEKFSHICLCFDMSLIPDNALKEALENKTRSIRSLLRSAKAHTTHIANYMQKAFDAHKEQKKGWELEVMGCLCLIFSLLKETECIKYDVSVSKNFSFRIMKYIEKNYSSQITSADASKELFISESYFCRIFKSDFGQPFSKYLCMYRIEKAKTLLKTTSLSVSEISGAVGFNSFSYFSKMFREFTLKTPLEYRNENRLDSFGK